MIRLIILILTGFAVAALLWGATLLAQHAGASMQSFDSCPLPAPICTGARIGEK